MGSDCGEGPLSAGQVCDGKTNASEPTDDAPKSEMMASKPGWVYKPRDKGAPMWCALSPGSDLWVASVVSGVEVA